MKVDRREMNRKMSEICARYGLDYWVWTPADYDLKDPKARAKALNKHEELYRDCEELTGVFFPGGDPGNNPAQLVIPFLEDIAKRPKEEYQIDVPDLGDIEPVEIGQHSGERSDQRI